MTDTPMTLLSVEIPTSTYRMLQAYAKARNGPLSNAASAAIRDGIEATCLLHPKLQERAGLPHPHPASTACRLAHAQPPAPPQEGERACCKRTLERAADVAEQAAENDGIGPIDKLMAHNIAIAIRALAEEEG